MLGSNHCGSLSGEPFLKNHRTSTGPPNENQKQEPRLRKHSGERNNQEELNLSPQRAVQLLTLPGGLGYLTDPGS
jgi:hypothetical protein